LANGGEAMSETIGVKDQSSDPSSKPVEVLDVSGKKRQVIVFAGASAAEIASFLASAPAGTEMALVVRNIPSGTQAISNANLDAPISDVAQEATQALIKAKTDNLDIALTVLRDALRGASNKTLTDIEANTDQIETKLDTANTHLTNVETYTDGIEGKLDLVASQTTADLIRQKTDNLDSPLSNMQASLDAQLDNLDLQAQLQQLYLSKERERTAYYAEGGEERGYYNKNYGRRS